jgi:hypothetical protein
VNAGLEREISKAIAVLVMPRVASSSRTVEGRRSLISRIFLLYKPTSGWLWIVHSLFYLMIGVVGFGSLGATVDTSGDSVDGYIGLGFFVVVSVALNLFANARDRKNRTDPPGLVVGDAN